VVQAGVDWPDGSSYFFGPQGRYVKWQSGASEADPTRKVLDHWSGWPAGWEEIDAAVRFPNNQAYFFKGFDYISVDVRSGVASGIKNIKANWDNTSWPVTWGFLDAAIDWDNGFAYFFKGGEYLKYPLNGNKIAAGPKPIAGNWQGWPAGWGAPNAAIMWPELIDGRKKAFFFLGDEYIRFDVADGVKDWGPAKIRDYWRGLKRA
jgi:matrix metalloproteinase-14 (membrane-inserted)